MTELEKKAEEYAELKVDLATSMYNPRAYELIKQAYLDGHKEGQKGKNYFNKFVQVSEENKQLQKENEELKAQLKSLEDRIHNLIIKNASLEIKLK